MKKLYLVLICCLTICNNAYARKGISSEDVAENLLNLSVGESYNLYLNRRKYPVLDKFIQQTTENSMNETLIFIITWEDMDKDFKNILTDHLYEMDIHKERTLFYQKVDEKIIKVDNDYFAAFSAFLLIHCFANALTENFDNMLIEDYNTLYKKIRKSVGIGLIISQDSDPSNINQNIYMYN